MDHCDNLLSCFSANKRTTRELLDVLAHRITLEIKKTGGDRFFVVVEENDSKSLGYFEKNSAEIHTAFTAQTLPELEHRMRSYLKALENLESIKPAFQIDHRITLAESRS